ncbi:MAG: IPT/TIG domain-containing protein [Nitrospiraceae bacterium]
MFTRFSPLLVLVFAVGLVVTPMGGIWAKEKEEAKKETQGSHVEGSGFSLFDTESIKGFDESKVKKDPVCDRSKLPKINKVEPDEAKPGDRVVIKGENFGTKECFHSVTFSSASSAKVDYKFVNDTTVEAKVPDAKSGMTFVIIVTGAGSAQSKPVLVKAK